MDFEYFPSISLSLGTTGFILCKIGFRKYDVDDDDDNSVL